MGLEMLTARDRLPRAACRYQRLRGELAGDGGDGVASRAREAAGSARARRPLRLRRRGCKAAGRWRAATGASGRRLLRLRLMRLVVLLVPARRVAVLFAELVRRLAVAVAASAVDAAAADCPAIVFSSQWGLPVLSHSASTSRSARLRALYLERSLSAGSGTGTVGSPC